ncbi:F-box only protein 15 [Nematolebias whitei]|uniref:F-box only protein 15 n=1 Tax=Nematolebias whitei TaxID=451745 RepID=UPI0018970AE9|nr:F-box only protein 15 [Nematolebias whitei]
MAAGRGEFFRSFLEGLQGLTVQPAPWGQQPSRGRGRPGPGGALTAQGRGRGGGRRRKKRTNVELRTASATEPRDRHSGVTSFFPETKLPLFKENVLERLPSEILMRILSFLDASSLFCVSHVSRLLHRLSNDDVLWERIYLAEFGCLTWKLQSADDVKVTEEEEEEEEEHPVSRWKKMYFKMIVGQEMKKWRRDLKDLSPYTGLPRQMDCVLRSLSVSWELTLCDLSGRQSTFEQSAVRFFKSSLVLTWSRGFHVRQYQISSIQLYGVRNKASTSTKTRKPGWRSQILDLDVKSSPCRFIGKDRLIKVLLLQPGVVVGIWRGQNQVAFIMISLHFHKLVEKSLLGSPVCPYSEPADPPPAGDSDPELGLHGYTLDFVLHNTGTEIMSGHFRQLSCSKVQVCGLLELSVIDGADVSQHRGLSGSVRLPWSSDEMEGAVENCCFMTLTLLDEFQKHFWCVSVPVHISMATRAQSWDYSGEDFLMEYQDPEGKVRMKLVWLEEQKQFFLISLTVYLSAAKVNKHFSRAY